MTDEKTIYLTPPMQIFILRSIKAPLLEGVQTITSPTASKLDKLRALRKIHTAVSNMGKLPEPTKENTWHPNSRKLIEIRDRFFKHCFLDAIRLGFTRSIINFVIILYDFDPPWRWMFDSVKVWAFEMEWEPRGYGSAKGPEFGWWRE